MVTLKKSMILDYARLTESENFKGSCLVLYTASSIISGHLVKQGDASSPTGTLAALTSEFSKQYYADQGLPNNCPLDGNDGFVLLKDVTIKYGQELFSCPFLCVFLDQIVAASVGNIN